MHKAIFWTAVSAALLFTGCKKQQAPEPTPVVEAPAVAWVWGPALFDGSREADTTGTLTVHFSATNESDTGLVLNTVALRILGDDGEAICSSKTSNIGKAAMGNEVKGSVDLQCDYTKLPESGTLRAGATLLYRLGEEERQDAVEVDVNFKR